VLTNSWISKTTNSTQNAAAVDPVADGQCAIELERVTKSGNVGHVRYEFLPVAQLFILRIVEGLYAVRILNPKDFSRRQVGSRYLPDRDLVKDTFDMPGGFIPANPAEQDDVTAVIVRHNFTRELVEHVEAWVSARKCPYS
jgi:hypothetical protein